VIRNRKRKINKESYEKLKMKDVMHVMTSVEEDYIYKKKSVVLRLE